MPDPFSIALGVIQVADTGFKLADTIYNYTYSVRKAEKQLRPIGDYVKTTSTALEEIASHLKDEELRALYRPALLERTEDALKGCKAAFEALDAYIKTLTRDQFDGERGFVPTKTKLTWPWKQKELDGHQVHLERYKSTFNVLLGTLTFVSSSRTAKDTLSMKVKLQQLIDAEKQANEKAVEFNSQQLFRLEQETPLPAYAPGQTSRETSSIPIFMNNTVLPTIQPAADPRNIPSGHATNFTRTDESGTANSEDTLLIHLNQCAAAIEKLSETLNHAIIQWEQRREYKHERLLPDFHTLHAAVQRITACEKSWLGNNNNMLQDKQSDCPGVQQAQQFDQDEMELDMEWSSSAMQSDYPEPGLRSRTGTPVSPLAVESGGSGTGSLEYSTAGSEVHGGNGFFDTAAAEAYTTHNSPHTTYLTADYIPSALSHGPSVSTTQRFPTQAMMEPRIQTATTHANNMVTSYQDNTQTFGSQSPYFQQGQDSQQNIYRAAYPQGVQLPEHLPTQQTRLRMQQRSAVLRTQQMQQQQAMQQQQQQQAMPQTQAMYQQLAMQRLVAMEQQKRMLRPAIPRDSGFDFAIPLVEIPTGTKIGNLSGPVDEKREHERDAPEKNSIQRPIAAQDSSKRRPGVPEYLFQEIANSSTVDETARARARQAYHDVQNMHSFAKPPAELVDTQGQPPVQGSAGDEARTPAFTYQSQEIDHPRSVEDYELQLKLLEDQNKRKLLMRRQQQDYDAKLYMQSTEQWSPYASSMSASNNVSEERQQATGKIIEGVRPIAPRQPEGSSAGAMMGGKSEGVPVLTSIASLRAAHDELSQGALPGDEEEDGARAQSESMSNRPLGHPALETTATKSAEDIGNIEKLTSPPKWTDVRTLKRRAPKTLKSSSPEFLPGIRMPVGAKSGPPSNTTRSNPTLGEPTTKSVKNTGSIDLAKATSHAGIRWFVDPNDSSRFAGLFAHSQTSDSSSQHSEDSESKPGELDKDFATSTEHRKANHERRQHALLSAGAASIAGESLAATALEQYNPQNDAGERRQPSRKRSRSSGSKASPAASDPGPGRADKRRDTSMELVSDYSDPFAALSGSETTWPPLRPSVGHSNNVDFGPRPLSISALENEVLRAPTERHPSSSHSYSPSISVSAGVFRTTTRKFSEVDELLRVWTFVEV